MSAHPLIDLANTRDVKQAKGFRAAAEKLTGESLNELYKQEVANAPRRHDAGKKYLGSHPKPPTGPRNGKEAEHFAMSLLAHAQAGGEFELPEGGNLTFIDFQVPLATAAEDKSQGDADPNGGVGKVDLIGMLPDDRLAVVVVKYVPPTATRGGTGDTPLRALLEGFAATAFVDANREALSEEIKAASGRAASTEPPALILLGNPRYWEICRKREAQKGAGWIREFERIARESSEVVGTEILYLGVDAAGDPPWKYTEAGPELAAEPQLATAWEPRAGKLKPKPRPRPRSGEENALVEPDMSRPPRAYGIRESYEPGDRIDHPTLGVGVVQAIAGIGKIAVLFDDRKSLLVHERQ